MLCKTLLMVCALSQLINCNIKTNWDLSFLRQMCIEKLGGSISHSCIGSKTALKKIVVRFALKLISKRKFDGADISSNISALNTYGSNLSVRPVLLN